MALDSLYGGGILAQGLGQGLQGLVEGYKLKRELDNQAANAGSLMNFRAAEMGGIDSRNKLYEEKIAALQDKIDHPKSGADKGAADLASLQKSIYGSDPAQLAAAYNAMRNNQPLPPFRPPTPKAPAAPAAAPGGPGPLARFASLFGAGQGGAAPVPAPRAGYNWRDALQTQ